MSRLRRAEINSTYRRVHEEDRHNGGRDPLVAHNIPPLSLVALHLDQIDGEDTHDQARYNQTQRRHKRVQQCLEVENARLVIRRLARDQAVDGQNLYNRTNASTKHDCE